MKNNFFKFILSMVLMFVAVSMVAQDYMNIYFNDGKSLKFFLPSVKELFVSKYDIDGVLHDEYKYQYLVTNSNTYIYNLDDINSITYTKCDESEVNQNIISSINTVFPVLEKCNSITDVESKLDLIKNAEGIEDAWSDGSSLCIKIKNWGVMAFHFHEEETEEDENEGESKLARQLLPLREKIHSVISKNGSLKVAIANQTKNNQNPSFTKISKRMEEIGSLFEDVGITPSFVDPSIDFFSFGMYEYDLIILCTHGSIMTDSNGYLWKDENGDYVHFMFTSDYLGSISKNFFSSEEPSDEKTLEATTYFKSLLKIKGLEDFFANDEIRIDWIEELHGTTDYWIAYPLVTENFIRDASDAVFSNRNSLLFAAVCHSLEGSNSLAIKLHNNKNLGNYLGFDGEVATGVGSNAALYFISSLLSGNSMKKSESSIPEKYKTDTSWRKNTKLVPLFSNDGSDFLFSVNTNEMDVAKARNDFKNSKYVEVEGLATILDRNKSEALNAITYGFVYGTDERLASGEKATSKLTYGTYISSTDKMALSSTIDKGNVLFKSKLTEIDPEKTYYYRAYTYDGIYYNYGIPCSFIINPPIRLNDGESYIIDDVAYTVRSKEKRICQVGYGTNTVKPSARKRVGSDIVPAILPDREGVLSIPEEAGYLSVIAVGDYSFYDCYRLTAINLPETIEEIGESAMSGCIGLSSITIPKNVKAISRNAFGGCKNVKSIYAEMTNPFTINENVFQTAAEEQSGTASSIFANATLYVPVGSKNQYATTPGWNRFQRIDEYTPGGDNPDPSNNDDSIITFADAGVASICVERWDTNGDGMLSMDEAAAVTDLGDKFNYDITSFDELQYFTGLTRIGNYVFSGCIKLTSVTLPNTITTIGEQAFSDCSNLTSIIIPNSVTTIENCAFMCCTGLTNVTIPNSVTTIMSQAFDGCSSLYSLTIPNSATYIDDWAFRGCYGLNSVTFHCKAIKGWFMGNQSIREIVIGDEVTTIEDFAFEGCSGLVSVTIPHSVTNIGDNAFSGCNGLVTVTFHCDEIKCLYFGNSLKEVIIGDEVSSIGDYAFNNCTSLESVIIGNSVTSIGKSAFYGCINLTSLTIGNSVKSIGESAFYDCKCITSVTIPNSIETIGWLAFYGCNSLVSVTFHCEVINSWFGENNIKEIVIGDEVTSIGDYAFSGFTGLTSVTIPNSVTSIGQSAFHSCTGLTSVILPNSVITIGREAFYDCSSLTSLTIPNSVTSIGYGAFHGCTGLKEVYSYIEDPSSIGYNMFSFNLYDVILYVPAGTKALYEATVGWNRFPSIVEMGGETSR